MDLHVIEEKGWEKKRKPQRELEGAATEVRVKDSSQEQGVSRRKEGPNAVIVRKPLD